MSEMRDYETFWTIWRWYFYLHVFSWAPDNCQHAQGGFGYHPLACHCPRHCHQKPVWLQGSLSLGCSQHMVLLSGLSSVAASMTCSHQLKSNGFHLWNFSGTASLSRVSLRYHLLLPRVGICCQISPPPSAWVCQYSPAAVRGNNTCVFTIPACLFLAKHRYLLHKRMKVKRLIDIVGINLEKLLASSS